MMDGLYGLYRSQYTTPEGVTRNLVVSQCQATYGRAVFPMFDEPSFKGTMDIEVCYRADDASFNATSNMPISQTQVNSLGETCTSFEKTPPIRHFQNLGLSAPKGYLCVRPTRK